MSSITRVFKKKSGQCRVLNSSCQVSGARLVNIGGDGTHESLGQVQVGQVPIEKLYVEKTQLRHRSFTFGVVSF